MRIKEIMKPLSSKVKKQEISVNVEESIDNAALLMREHNLREIQVVDENNVVGIVTRKSVVESSDDINEDFFFD